MTSANSRASHLLKSDKLQEIYTPSGKPKKQRAAMKFLTGSLHIQIHMVVNWHYSWKSLEFCTQNGQNFIPRWWQKSTTDNQ